ncbi:hypothetical protein BHF90_00775 [Corynebacterium diphtheriae]|nr:hypothetical protein BHF90_00775 [Corynebacterium diphtheriae]
MAAPQNTVIVTVIEAEPVEPHLRAAWKAMSKRRKDTLANIRHKINALYNRKSHFMEFLQFRDLRGVGTCKNCRLKLFCPVVVVVLNNLSTTFGCYVGWFCWCFRS